MKRCRIAASIALGLFFPAASASAWWQWFHQHIPCSPGPGIWFYQEIPHGAAPTRLRPQTQRFQSFSTGPTSTWSTAMPMSSLFLEQLHTPMGYTIRVRTGNPGAQDLEIGLEGHALVIKKRDMTQTALGMPIQMQQSGWSTQWVSLPADANLAALRMARGNGMVEIFVPRTR